MVPRQERICANFCTQVIGWTAERRMDNSAYSDMSPTTQRTRQATTRAREGERPSGVSTWGKRQADRQAATVAVPSEKNKRRGARAPSGPCWNNSQVISVSSVNAIYWFSSANILLSTRGRFSRDRFTMNIGMNTILVKLY
jgi:hypothetical protein